MPHRMNSNHLANNACNTGFHRPHTPVGFAIAYSVMSVLLLVTLVPFVVDRRSSQRAAHRNLAAERASAFAAFIDSEVSNMFGSRELLRGFVKSAAPLRAPNYTSMNVSERVAVAMSSATASGAMSPDSYARVARIVNNSFAGYRNAAVYAGLVTVFSETGRIQVGTDVLPRFPSDWEYCVRNARGYLGLPRPSLTTGQASDFVMVLRSPIFIDFHRIAIGDPNRINPATGKHVNWEFLWGAITLAVDMHSFALEMQRQILPGESDLAWMFETRETYQQGVLHNRSVLFNTTDMNRFSEVDPVSECSQTPLFRALCVSVIPAQGEWDGSDLTVIAYAVLVALGCPAVALLSVYGIIRAVVGPKPDPLKYAPTKAPLHAVCVDLPDANRLWSEVPFIMHDVTMTFGEHVDALAAQHRVYVTMRLGCTAVAVTNSRERAVDFARAFAEWALNFAWPSHIIVHCPRGTINFAGMLHTMDNVTVRIDREQGQCEVTGDDMKALLLLRVAAVEQHVMCTGEFLGLPSLTSLELGTGARVAPSATHQNRLVVAAPASVVSAESGLSTRDLVAELGGVGELGVFRLPLPVSFRGGPAAPAVVGAAPQVPLAPPAPQIVALRGYIVPSVSTEGRAITDILDTFPDEVWAEWQAPGEFDSAGFRNVPVTPLNPLGSAASLAGLSRSSRAWGSSSSPVGHRLVVAAHNTASTSSGGPATPFVAASWTNGGNANATQADRFLPGNALDDISDVAKLLALLLAFLPPPQRVRDSRRRHRRAGRSSGRTLTKEDLSGLLGAGSGAAGRRAMVDGSPLTRTATTTTTSSSVTNGGFDSPASPHMTTPSDVLAPSPAAGDGGDSSDGGGPELGSAAVGRGHGFAASFAAGGGGASSDYETSSVSSSSAAGGDGGRSGNGNSRNAHHRRVTAQRRTTPRQPAPLPSPVVFTPPSLLNRDALASSSAAPVAAAGTSRSSATAAAGPALLIVTPPLSGTGRVTRPGGPTLPALVDELAGVDPMIDPFVRKNQTLFAALSVSTYFLAAYRTVFAPLDPEVRQAMVSRVCSAVGVPSEDYSFALAVRCTQLTMGHYYGGEAFEDSDD